MVITMLLTIIVYITKNLYCSVYRRKKAQGMGFIHQIPWNTKLATWLNVIFFNNNHKLSSVILRLL